ncbi:methyltransferase domain-containing protein [Kineococcus rhizosphaerae]|uniref:methyltransferase domain-containing protein n=1 Tax=Kineococcus rhizosphaerae TaxID=559628 RepID=UPI000D0486F9
MDLLSVHLGDRLGWYRALEAAPADPDELARRTGTARRCARERCRQQAATGLLRQGPDGRYGLAPGVRQTLVDEHDLRFSVPLARLLAGLAVQVPHLLEAYRAGTGVGWAQFGDDVRNAQAAANRPWFEKALAGTVNSVPDLADRFARAGTVADIGCGAGWSSIAIARAWPATTVVGLDVDAPSVDSARADVHEAGLDDRVQIRLADAGDATGFGGPFDLVTAFECVHDLPHPVAVLDAARRSLTEAGAVLVVDEAVAEEPAPVGDPVERMMHGWSVLACLPDSMTTPGSVATGTVMRPSTLARYARYAGFSLVEPLGVEGFGLLAFTLLVPWPAGPAGDEPPVGWKSGAVAQSVRAGNS